MSFNSVEVARAADFIALSLPDRVQAIELLSFPLRSGSVADLNVALRLENARKAIVFSLKTPWTGLFFLPPNAFTPTNLTWASAFGGGESWNSYIHGSKLERIAVREGDRVVTLAFDNGAELVVELFPARPNWALMVGGQEIRWRAPSATAPGPRVRPADAALLAAREFEGVAGADWMARAYRHYLVLREALLLKSAIQRAASQLQARAAHVFKIRSQMQGSLAESAKVDRLRAQAETLKAKLHELPPGAKLREVDGIALDPSHTVAENITRLFNRCKKLQRTAIEVQARLAGVDEEARRIAASAAKVRAFTGDYPAFVKLAETLGVSPTEEGGAKKPQTKDAKKWGKLEAQGVRRFQSKDGLAVWVGRNHKENEELVIRLARGNDVWLHLKGKPGAHVVVQVPNGKSASLETLLDAATLAAHYSGVSGADKVEVDYTFRKNVKRVAGQGGEKFLVTYSQNRTLMIKIEDERLQRLLKQH